MSKSLKRVKSHIQSLGLDVDVLELTVSTRTAAEAATVVGCGVDQIAKSIVFRGETSDQAVVFLTAGGQRVDLVRAAHLAGEALGKADADFIRRTTGFAIGGVSPFGHLSPPRIFLDAHLLSSEEIWVAAGTPHHMFKLSSSELLRTTGATAAEFTQAPA